MIENLVAFSIASFLLALSPGPDNIYVLAQSLANGSKSGLATSAGLVSGVLVHTTLLALGISAIIATSPALFYGIKIAGATYLLYLAYLVYNSDESISLHTKAPKKSLLSLFKQGFVMNLINPKVLVFFLGFFPGFLWDDKQQTIFQFYVLGVVFMVVAFITFASISLLAGTVSNYLSKHKKTGLILKWIQVVVFIGITIFILIT